MSVQVDNKNVGQRALCALQLKNSGLYRALRTGPVACEVHAFEFWKGLKSGLGLLCRGSWLGRVQGRAAED